MQKGICYVVGAGEEWGADFVPQPEDYVVAADAGFQLLERKGIAMDAVIGDFDSLGFRPEHDNVILLNAEKDDTDMRAAVMEGIKAGYDVFRIYGGTGGRIEHTIANIQLLAELSQSGKQGFLFGRDVILTVLTNKTIEFQKGISGYISVFAHSEKAKGVFLKGLKYELENAVLTNTYPLGVSNEFMTGTSSVSVENGTLLVIFPAGAEWNVFE